MELRDIVVTPLVLVMVFLTSLYVKSRIEDPILRRYFMPALWLKIFGALALGFIYQFYYNGGDTYNYHTLGSRIIWEAFADDYATGFKLLFAKPGLHPEVFSYSQKIPFYYDEKSFFIVRIAAFFDLLTFSSYSATAIFFALFGFAGAWAFFITFFKQFPHLHKWIAISILFIPSVIFWGSGVLKDTITLSALGLLTYAINKVLIEKKLAIINIILLLFSAWIIIKVKMYIILCFLPAAFFWVYAKQLFSTGSFVARVVFAPLLIPFVIVGAYFGVAKISEADEKYSLDKIAKTAQITAYDIRFWTGRDAGSGYTLGELDGTFTGMLALAPKAVNVSLFRPYLWEVKNPLMLLSAMESFLFLSITVFLLLRYPMAFLKAFSDPNILFCFIFSLVFAFGVGVSTFNFGTLARYKIPLLPFYALGLVLMVNKIRASKEEKY
ncbi:hypothetical protein SanaruYs_22720 [Chryseotalea sanaruensis]|uniref:Glycosyltransferase RgtA/B/C/D-like domain-containing protein n=1 Tax=Chryseotalea sanaruensis TaxID=2482724 RepID=A0A401UAX6_9BACT|nr:hypothetical protein [Chryseotalea sanaruensis]GCC52040.1 hypothetical protein SanaruYs_22720 [Chryseotalea sanaruensis]